MAKSKNNLLYIAASGVGAFYLYKAFRSWKKKSEAANQNPQQILKDEEQKRTAEKQAAENVRKNFIQSQDISNPNSYAGKVARIQAVLGVVIDGIPGRITNSEYAKRFGLERGEISPMTISYYLDKANSDTKFIGL